MAWLLLATVLVALAATFTFSDRGATLLPPPATTAAAEAQPCTRTQRAGYALDAALPLVTTRLTGACAAAPTSAGTTLTWILAVLQLLAWAAATLFVAGYTRIVRRA